MVTRHVDHRNYRFTGNLARSYSGLVDCIAADNRDPVGRSLDSGDGTCCGASCGFTAANHPVDIAISNGRANMCKVG